MKVAPSEPEPDLRRAADRADSIGRAGVESEPGQVEEDSQGGQGRIVRDSEAGAGRRVTIGVQHGDVMAAYEAAGFSRLKRIGLGEWCTLITRYRPED